jgi:hypothetical protein
MDFKHDVLSTQSKFNIKRIASNVISAHILESSSPAQIFKNTECSHLIMKSVSI